MFRSRTWSGRQQTTMLIEHTFVGRKWCRRDANFVMPGTGNLGESWSASGDGKVAKSAVSWCRSLVVECACVRASGTCAPCMPGTPRAKTSIISLRRPSRFNRSRLIEPSLSNLRPVRRLPLPAVLRRSYCAR